MPGDPLHDDPHELDCDEALERVYEFLDGELTDEVEQAIRRHLAACARCEPKFAHERVFLEFVAQRGKLKHAPPELRRRIMQDLVDRESRRASE